MSDMKAKFLKLILLAVMMMPSAMSTAQTQTETNSGELNEALKFLYDNMVYVEGGTYLKGEEQISTTVNSFYCCRYETVNWLWRLIMGIADEDDLWPMMGPTWSKCQHFINQLNQYAGIKYRLLTDDEWEFAARGGNLSKGYLYAGSNNIDEVAWYESNFSNAYQRVGMKRPNELGIYDMSGGAEEWCQDSVPNDNGRRRTPIVDVDSLPDPPDFGAHRYVRGGGLFSSAVGCTVYAHYDQPGEWSMPTIGSRLALDVSEYNKKKPSKFRIGLKTAEYSDDTKLEANSIYYDSPTNKFIFSDTDQTTKEVDIAQVNYITSAPIGNLEIPDGATFVADDITILGDGAKVKVGDDGTFTTNAKSVVALGKDHRLMYFSYASFEESPAIHEVKLNSKETAISLLLPTIPNVFFLASDDVIERLKQLLSDLDVTKELALAIDRSIIMNGYLDINLVRPEFETAVNNLVKLMGKDALSQQTSFAKMKRTGGMVAPAKPKTPTISSDARMGFVLEDSQWEHGTNPYTGEEQGYWNCKFSVTSTRFAAMALLLGHIDGTTIVNYPYSDEMDVFDNLIPAYSSKIIYERMTTLEGLYEQLQILSLGDEHLHLFDEVLVKDVKFNFYKEGDCIMVMGPTTDPYLLLYHILNGVVCPFVKAVGGEIEKYYDNKYKEEKYDLKFNGISSRYKKFVISLVKEFAKAKKIVNIVDVINSDKTRSEIVDEITDIIYPIVTDKILEDMKEAAKETGKSLLFSSISGALDDRIKNFEEFYKKETKFIEIMTTVIDVYLSFLGLNEVPVSYLDIELDFNAPDAVLDDIPGHRF